MRRRSVSDWVSRSLALTVSNRYGVRVRQQGYDDQGLRFRCLGRMQACLGSRCESSGGRRP